VTSVEVLGTDGQIDGRATIPITATLASGSGTLSGTATLNAVNGVAAFSDLRISGAGSHTIRFSAAGVTSGTSSAIAVRQVANALVLQTQPGGAFDGAPLTAQPRVQVVDHALLPMPAAVPVTVSIVSGAGALSGTTTVTSLNGVATFADLAIAGSGPHLLTFSAPGLTRVTSDEFTVTATGTAPTHLVVVTLVSGGTTDQPLPVQPIVEVRDQSNNVVTGSSAAITASLASGSGTLLGTTSVNAVNGVATFTDLTISGLGLHSLRFTTPGLTEATTLEFRIIAAP
jgi:hypothetical protein